MTKLSIEKVGILLLILIAVIVSLMVKSEDTKNYIPNQFEKAVKSHILTTDSIAKFDLIGNGYHLLYEELSLPNTLEIKNLPEITGDHLADQRIRELAELRGYKVRRIVINTDGLHTIGGTEKLQPYAQINWLQLEKEAEKANIYVRVRSGYRSIEEQRDLFINRLNEIGVITHLIETGTQDIAINEVLSKVAPPGYSRHHNGYTIDVESINTDNFAASREFRWMSADNYANSLKFGFIPSYPEGAIKQGPNPEAWEFVWVGIDLIKDQIDEN